MLRLFACILGLDRSGGFYDADPFASELANFSLLVEGLFFRHCKARWVPWKFFATMDSVT